MELIISFGLAVILFGGYLVYALLADPSGSHPIGHLMGAVGLLLMVMTETLYSLRKRVRWFRFGPLRLWLSFHIITGIVGPWLALLHSAFEFRGLAGLATLLTLLVVLSGFVGRYIYVAIPRSPDGVAMDVNHHRASPYPPHQLLHWWRLFHFPLSLTLFITVVVHVVTTIYFGGLNR